MAIREDQRERSHKAAALYQDLILNHNYSHKRAVAEVAERFHATELTVVRNWLYQARKDGVLGLRYGRPIDGVNVEGEDEPRTPRGRQPHDWDDVALSGIWQEEEEIPLEELKEGLLKDPFKLLNRLAGFQDFVKKSSEIAQSRISVDINRPRALLVGWGDLHMDSLFADIPRLERELELIRVLDAYVVFLGDGLDNPVKYQNFDTFLQPKVSRYIFGRIMDRIPKGRLIGMISGDHERHGVEKADYDYIEQYCVARGVPFLGHWGEISLHLAGVSYRFGVAHKGRGYSHYNPFHGGVRLLREEFPGMDGVIIGHIHTSGIAIQVEQGGQKAIMQIGARKQGDRFANRIGYIPHEANENLPVLELDGEGYGYVIYNDIEEAMRAIGERRRHGHGR